MKYYFWPIIGWLIFITGYLSIAPSILGARSSQFVVLLPPLFMLLTVSLRSKTRIQKILDHHTREIDQLPLKHIGIWIALSAGLALYLELLMIRLHASYFQFFAYFKNVSLLSCFLGLGIGYLKGDKKPLTTVFVIPFLCFQVIFLYLLKVTEIGSLLQNPVSDQFTFGLKQTVSLKSDFIVYGMLIMVFIFNTYCFIPLGHLTSFLMSKKEKLASYGWNLIGSIAGILLFSFVSFLWVPPVTWLILGFLLLCLFLARELPSLAASFGSMIFLVIVLTYPAHINNFTVYSPYQNLELNFKPYEHFTLKTSNTYFQRILYLGDQIKADHTELGSQLAYYSLPYIFKKNPDHVLVVGSGTGNDVAAALRANARSIDAVEIDPAIIRFGSIFHPERPYQAGNVSVINTDARAYLRHTDKRYDLIVYGLLDSHTLLSGASGSIRLDSYVYTVEAFKEARAKLNKDGMISLTFSILDDKLARKIYMMLEEAFEGKPPIVYKTVYDAGLTFLAGEHLPSVSVPSHMITLTEVTDFYANVNIPADKSTDNWPFFYMPVKKYPVGIMTMLMVLLCISFNLVRMIGKGQVGQLSWPCFFLGAGFMLLETKGITELALVYGSTWMVVSVVILAILILAFCANACVLKWGRPPTVLTYGLLFTALSLSYGLTFFDFGSTSDLINKLVYPVLLMLPLFFSGFAFSCELLRTKSVAVALSANLLGAMLGGFLEYNSMFFGFRFLYILAAVMYLLAYISSIRPARN